MNTFLIILILYNVKFGQRRDTVYLFDHAEAQPKRSDCNKPITGDFLYHSCLDVPYPRDRTTCHCSSNYNQIINLFCDEDADWVIQGSDRSCTDELNPYTNYVEVFTSRSYSFRIGLCNKPWEQVYYFHLCDKSGYPKSTTECYCSFNYPKNVTLYCNYNKWYIGDWENQCRGDNKESTAIVRLDAYYHNPIGSRKKPEEQLNFFHNCEDKHYPAGRTSCWAIIVYTCQV